MRSLFAVKHGYAFDGKFFTSEGNYVLLTPGNFFDEGGFKLKEKGKYYTGEIPDGYLLHRGDLLVAMTEQAEGLLGSSAIIPESGKYLHNQRLGLITSCQPDLIDILFLYHLFNTREVRAQIRASASGVKVRHTSPSRIGEVKVRIPSVPTQRSIASILSAYDDLIENNTRRIAILEAMARAIYREWFVNFRFPGHEAVKLVDSPLRKIPQAWRVVKVEDAILINPRTTVPRDGDKAFVSMGAVPHNTMLIDLAQVEMRTGNSGSKFKNGDTLFARITPCLENGKTAFVQFLPSDEDVAFGSTEFIVLRSRSLCPEFVYLLARSNAFRDNAIKSMSGATGRQRVQEKCFDNFHFAHPDPKTLSEFASFMQPVFRSVFTLAKKNANLRNTRDLLLPKLISGQLDVEHIDIDLGDVAPVLEETAS